jgi:hypothetical protein
VKHPGAFRAAPAPEALSFDSYQLAGGAFFALREDTASHANLRIMGQTEQLFDTAHTVGETAGKRTGKVFY